MISSNTRTKKWALPKIALVMALFGSFANNSVAQVLVTDAAAIAATEAAAAAEIAATKEGNASQFLQRAANFGKQVAHYGLQIDHWAKQILHYQEFIVDAMSLGTNISLTSNALTKAEAGSLISQNCPGADGLSGLVTSLVSSISPNQPIAVQQRQVCAQIVTLQVDQYNRTVDMLNQLNEYGGTLQKLSSLVDKASTIGSTTSATTQAATYNATVTKAMSDWQAATAGNEAMIKALNQQQSMLSKTALNGTNSWLGNVVRGAAFAAAFD